MSLTHAHLCAWLLLALPDGGAGPGKLMLTDGSSGVPARPAIHARMIPVSVSSVAHGFTSSLLRYGAFWVCGHGAVAHAVAKAAVMALLMVQVSLEGACSARPVGLLVFVVYNAVSSVTIP